MPQMFPSPVIAVFVFSLPMYFYLHPLFISWNFQFSPVFLYAQNNFNLNDSKLIYIIWSYNNYKNST